MEKVIFENTTKKINVVDALKLRKDFDLLLSIRNTGLSFIISQNLFELEKIGYHHQKTTDILKKQFTETDESGNPKKYKLEIKDSISVFVLDESGNPVEGTGQAGSASRINPLHDSEYRNAIKELNELEYEVNFKIIPSSRIEDLCERNIIESFDFTNLLTFELIK